MIKRDKYGYIGQHNADYLEYFDMGDTARSTGLMAMTGSAQDQLALVGLVKWDTQEKTLRVVRHPEDPRWSNYRLTSRDQVMCVAAGYKKHPVIKLLGKALLTYAKEGRVNKDILLPHYRLVLHKATYNVPSWLLAFSGYPLLLLHLLYNARVVPNAEQNQTIAMLSVMPHWWLKTFCFIHPNIRKNLMDYWGGKPWRDQEEIAIAILDWLERDGYL